MSFRWVPRWQLRTEVRRYNVDCKARVLRFVWRIRWRLRDGFAFVEAGVVVEGGEGAGLHAVNVERAVEVIDFVLQDAGVPTGGWDGLRLTVLVQILDSNASRPGDDGGKAGKEPPRLFRRRPQGAKHSSRVSGRARSTSIRPSLRLVRPHPAARNRSPQRRALH